jgi:hypothetical protein
MLSDPQEERDPEAINCPNPKCEGDCAVCDGGVPITGSDMWTAIAWAEDRGLPVEYAEPMSREDYLDEYGPDR